MATTYTRELNAMKRAALAAGTLSLRFRQKGFRKHAKADASPVTDADVACEKNIRAILGKAFPSYGFMGEEQGEQKSTSGGVGKRFIIDPIDGTSDFILGTPYFAQLLALEVDGAVVAGVIYLPALKQLFWAQKGGGAFMQTGAAMPKRLHVSKTKSLSNASICLTGGLRVSQFSNHLHALRARPTLTRTMSGIWSNVLVLQGKLDAEYGPAPWPWDLAASKIIIEQAGGRYSNQNGNPSIYPKPGFNNLEGDFILFSNGHLHNAVLKVLNRKP